MTPKPQEVQGDRVAADDCSCFICAEVDPGRDDDIVEVVGRHGWVSLGVIGDVDFAYTIGLWHTFRQPEAVMFGLQGLDMQLWLNAFVEHGRAIAWPKEDHPFTGVMDGVATQLRPVEPSWHDALFGTAQRFYRGEPVPVRQLVWADRNGRWPGDEAVTASSRNRQAQAWLPVAQHPPGAWRLMGELEPGFPFRVGPATWALTTQAVLNQDRPVVQVANIEGSYDVLDERAYDADDLCLAFLGTLVQLYPHLTACADLPAETVATAGTDHSWIRTPVQAKHRRISRRRRKRARPSTSV